MELSKKLAPLILFFLAGSNFLGCASATDYLRKYQDQGLSITMDKYDTIMADIEQYIGKSKNELKEVLGKPTRTISPSTWKNVEYDEEWVYEQGVPFVNKQYRMFYIKEDIVIHVEFGGIF